MRRYTRFGCRNRPETCHCARPGVDVRVVSTKLLSWRAQFAAVRWSDAVMLNSNCLWMALACRLTAKPALLKLHYPQYHAVHWTYVPMSFTRRMTVEIRHLLGLSAGLHYKAMSIARLMLRTVVALLVSRVCACSQYCANQASLPRPVSVLRNPIRVEPGLPPRDISDLDFPYRFVFVGRVTKEKGWTTLVDAAQLLARENGPFLVDIVGTGDELDPMKARVTEYGLSHRFHYHGRLDAAAVRTVLARALCVVMPSSFQEPAGYIPLEAASLRVVSIVSRVGGLAETAGPYCPSFGAGAVDELAKLMLDYLDNPTSALTAGYAAYLRASEEFSPRLLADELLRALGSNGRHIRA